jgi:ArsR family transcriptional regulator
MNSRVCLATDIYFDIIGNMEANQAIAALAALAQATRLEVYRLLVQAGPQGMAAGAIGEQLGLPPATLSFHLAQLSRAGLAQLRQQGRFVIYSVNFPAMNDLIGFLTENCCGGNPCISTATCTTAGEFDNGEQT